jgi:hypothetical protein
VNAVGRPVRAWLRLEGGVLLAASVAAYAGLDGGWLRFLLLFLVPDLSFLGYLSGPRLGAATYNLLHSYALPLALVVTAEILDALPLLLVALIWLAHIGFDRMLGYGLKYPTAFQDTHLGRIGRTARWTSEYEIPARLTGEHRAPERERGGS